MNRNRFAAFIASAFVLYIVASAAAEQLSVDAARAAVLVCAFLLALTPAFVTKGEPEDAPARVGTLGAALGVALAAWASLALHSLPGELLMVCLLPFAGVVTFELAVHAPDLPPRLLRRARSLALVRVLGIACALVGAISVLPPLTLFGRALILPYWSMRAPVWFALFALVSAFALRVTRRRLGSDARALAMNVWAQSGTALALALLLLSAAAARAGAMGAFSDLCIAVAAVSLVAGHAFMVLPRRAIDAGPRARGWVTTGLALGMLVPPAYLLLPSLPEDVFVQVGALSLFVLGVDLLRGLLGRAVRFVLSPGGGALLAAVRKARDAVASAFGVDQLAVSVLGPLRRAAGVPEAAPVLFLVNPAREVRLDAAGQARVVARPMPTAIARHFSHAGLLPIVRDDLALRVVRRPELRELLSMLDEADALVVLPLVVDAELEGALLVARGLRSSPLTLEELSELEALANEMSASTAVFAALDRAQLRVQAAAVRERQLSLNLADLRDELLSLGERQRLLEAAREAMRPEAPPVAYSPCMRALLSRLSEVAPHELPIALVGEVGTPLLQLAHLVHRESGRARAPFVVFDCATLSDDAARRTIFGERREDVSVPGWLELAADGTLVLEHVVALSPGLQAEIARALSERRARPVGAQTHYPVGARLVCTLRVAPIDLVASGALSAELSRWLEPTSYRVPPLRERAEDLESLILMAVDRAARVSGRQVPGLTPEVLNALREHVFLGNEQELESVVFRAVLACRGPRITLADLPPLASHSHASDGSFQEQEREILRRALERAQGNKTRAARALGLKRTTLIDKLRRLGLDDASQPLQH